MGWELAGFDVDRGRERRTPRTHRRAVGRGPRLRRARRERFGVEQITFDALERSGRADPSRTTYLLDVRTPEEYEAGHIPGSRNAPGGQLVQATDEYVATRNARLVLVDDNGVRATMTASWLRQMGWNDAVVLDGGVSRAQLRPGRPAPGRSVRPRPSRCPSWPTASPTRPRRSPCSTSVPA